MNDKQISKILIICGILMISISSLILTLMGFGKIDLHIYVSAPITAIASLGGGMFITMGGIIIQQDKHCLHKKR